MRPDQSAAGGCLGGKSGDQSFAKNLRIAAQITLALERRSVPDRDSFRTKKTTSMIGLCQFRVESFNKVDPGIMDDRSKLNELFVPRLDLHFERRCIPGFARFRKQSVLLLYNLVVPGQRAEIPGSNVDDSCIKEPASSCRFAPDHIHLFEGKREHVEITEILHQRLALTVNQKLLRGRAQDYLNLLVERVAPDVAA